MTSLLYLSLKLSGAESRLLTDVVPWSLIVIAFLLFRSGNLVTEAGVLFTNLWKISAILY